jgi:sulfur relay (sulfurtransferase) DsrC/TusE family protein
MQQADEDFWRRIDDDILDLLDLLRARWRNFNQVPPIEKLIVSLNQAYKASGKAADLMDRGHLE